MAGDLDHNRTRILRDACARAGITVKDALSPCRSPRVARPRFMVMAILRSERQWSLPTIGAALDRHHTTVLHGLRRHAQLTGGGDGQA